MPEEFVVEVAEVAYLLSPLPQGLYYRVCFHHRDLPVVFHLKEEDGAWQLVPQSLPYYVNNALSILTTAILERQRIGAAELS